MTPGVYGHDRDNRDDGCQVRLLGVAAAVLAALAVAVLAGCALLAGLARVVTGTWPS